MTRPLVIACGRGSGQVEGVRHPSAKLSDADVALARLLARERALPRGWLLEMAIALGVTDAALSTAIGGATWKCVTSPAPVRSYARHKAGGCGTRSAPRCPTCGHRKHYAVCNGQRCRDRFHSIDHRQFTSAANARRARGDRRHTAA